MTTTPTFELDDLNFWNGPTARVDEAFRWLRAHDPRRAFKELGIEGRERARGFFALTRYADVVEVSRRPADFCSGKGVNIFDTPLDLSEFFGSIIAMDDPRHARLRRIVARGFTPRSLEAMLPAVDRVTNEIIDSIAERGECDFVTDFSALLPLRIVLDMMGIPRSQEQFIFDITNVIFGATDPEYVEEQTPKGIASALATAGQELATLLRELAEARIENPRDDLITTLVVGDPNDEQLTPQELASFFILLVGAGNETTRNGIAHGLVALTNHPDQRRRWQDDFDSLAPSAIEEIVRFASPVTHMRRTVTSDGVRLGDQVFSEGDKVVMWYNSANRDEAVFEDPDAFKIARSPNPHIGFGAPGPHFCLGAHLARREMALAFRRLFERLPDIHADGEPVRLRSNFINGIKHLRARFTPARWR
jgi:cytochrome P450